MPSIFSGLDPLDDESRILFFRAAERLIKVARTMEPPWSIAELLLNPDDFAWLSSWASGLSGGVIASCLSDLRKTAEFGEPKVSYAAALGLMLITFAAESARRDATEGVLWPFVRRDSFGLERFARGADAELFLANDFPVVGFRKAIRRASRVFGLRHAFDEAEGKHRYFRTIFLQFGFSREDARRSLPSWLAGHPPQKAIASLLKGRQQSDSFRVFWNRLRLGHARWISREELKSSLQRSPWGRVEWIEELVEAASRKRASTDAALDRETLFESNPQLLSKPKFTWKLPEPPCFTSRIEGLSGLSELREAEYELQVADSRIRIVMDEDGDYQASSSEEIVLPSSATSVTAELLNANDEIVWTDVLDCRDPTALISVYKLPNGSRILEDKLFDPGGSYALVVPHSFDVEPKKVYQIIPGTDLVAHMVAPGEIGSTQITKDGLLFWRPRVPGRSRTLESEASRKVQVEIKTLWSPGTDDDRPRLQVQVEHPPDVTIHQARILDGDYPGKRSGRMTCFGPFGAPVELLNYPSDLESPPGTLDIVLRIERGDGQLELARKRANYNDHGAAIRRGDIWDPIPSTGLAELTIEDAQTHLFHIVPPHKKVDNTNPRVFRYIPPDAWKIRELYRCVMSVDHRRSVIHRLHGYGAPLLIDCGPEHGDKFITLARSVVDRGKIREVCEPTRSADGVRVIHINLTYPIEIEPGRHRVLWWDRSGRSVWLDPSPVCLDEGPPREDYWWRATLPDWAGEFRAIGVAYEGTRLGSWWSDQWADGLHQLGTNDVAQILRWLKLPLLDDRVRSSVDRFVTPNFGVWLFDLPPSPPFKYERNDLPWRDVVRALYRDQPVTNEQAKRLVEFAHEAGREEGPWTKLAAILCEIHPLLLIRVVKAFLGNVVPEKRNEARALILHIEQTFGESVDTETEEDQKTPPLNLELVRSAVSDQTEQDQAHRKSLDACLESRPALRYSFSRECLKELASQYDRPTGILRHDSIGRNRTRGQGPRTLGGIQPR